MTGASLRHFVNINTVRSCECAKKALKICLRCSVDYLLGNQATEYQTKKYLVLTNSADELKKSYFEIVGREAQSRNAILISLAASWGLK